MEKKSVLIVENTNKSLKKLDEGVVNGEKKYVLGGTFTEFDVRNRNDRIYTAEKFIPCLEELKNRMKTLDAVYGEFDHPDVFDTSLQRASHVIKDIGYAKESNTVEGQIQLLSTYWGKEAKSIVDDGFPIFVSSRAAGITESDGTVTLKKLFTYDIVADPGFGSAKMSSINESCGYSDESNFRIYEMSDESKINELFDMNKDDLVTKKQISEYSGYLVDEINKTKNKINEAVKVGKIDNKKIEELVAYYESLQEDQKKVIEYLDYLAEKMQIVVNENKELKDTQSKLIEHNDYLAENLEKSIDYSEYLAENLDKTIEYSEYIAENLDSSIEYSEYLAENLDNSIEYSEYIAENLDKSIEYSEYIAENVDKNIEYSEYIAEHVDNNIAYSEYIAENVEGNIAYAEYIAEHLDDNIAYSDYIAENLDKSISYQKTIVEKLNSDKIFENFEEGDRRLPLPEDEGFEVIDDEDDTVVDDRTDIEIEDEDDENCRVVCDDDEDVDMGDDEGSMDETPDMEGREDEDEDEEFRAELEREEEREVVAESREEEEVVDNREEDEEDEEVVSDREEREEEARDDEEVHENLDKKIDKLINEAKKRKASETEEHHFLKFLNKSQIDSFYKLERDEQEKVVAHINEKGDYMCSEDVLKLMREALAIKNETLEEKLIRLMPDSIKPRWEQLEESRKVSILSQARLYPELKTEQQVEHFWETRNIEAKPKTRQLVNESTLIQEDKLSDDDVNSILERIKTL